MVAWVGMRGAGTKEGGASYNFSGVATRFSYAVGGQIEFTNVVEAL